LLSTCLHHPGSGSQTTSSVPQSPLQ
jgi:hypothetical protein